MAAALSALTRQQVTLANKSSRSAHKDGSLT